MGLTINTKAIKDVCNSISVAIDTEEKSTISDTLEIFTQGNELFLAVTNREYFVQVKLDLITDQEFHATVDAKTFVKLLSQITTDTVDFSIDGTNLIVKGNGEYKFPMVFAGDELFVLPRIELTNITAESVIKSDDLLSIIKYNSKELAKVKESNLAYIQRLYYLDGNGSITFTNGAVVNDFKVDTNSKVLMSGKFVKLFKLFNKGDVVSLKLSNDPFEQTIQTKLLLKSDTVSLYAILPCNESLLNQFPVSAIRERSDKSYKYSVVLNTLALVKALNRIDVFNEGLSDIKIPFCSFEFMKNFVRITDNSGSACEDVYYESGTVCTPDDTYTMQLNLKETISTMSSYNDSEFISFHFGDEQATVVQKQNIKVVIPEVHL